MLSNLFNSKQETTNNGKGRFIVLDGTDGSGKNTQAKLLIETLEVSGYRHALFDFPQYKTHSAAMLERYLDGHYGDLGPKAASMLYAIDRFDASFKIREMIDDNKIVITNRYVTSNAGHQGGKIEDHAERIKFYKWLNEMEHEHFGIPRPHLNIILHVPVEISWELVKKRAVEENRKLDKHESDFEHLRRAEQVYLEIAELFPNTFLIECVEDDKLLSPKAIHAKVWETVRRMTLKDIQPELV